MYMKSEPPVNATSATDSPDKNDDWQRTVDDALSTKVLYFLEPVPSSVRQRSQWPASYTDEEQHLKSSKKALLRLADHQYDLYHQPEDKCLPTLDAWFSTCPGGSTADASELKRSESLDRNSFSSSISLASELDIASNLSPATPATTRTMEKGGLRPLDSQSNLLLYPEHAVGTPAVASMHQKFQRPGSFITGLNLARPPKHKEIEALSATIKPTTPMRQKRRRSFAESQLPTGTIDDSTAPGSVTPLAVTSVLPRNKGRGSITRTSWYAPLKPYGGMEELHKTQDSDLFDLESNQPKMLRTLCNRLQAGAVDEDAVSVSKYEPPRRLSLPRISMLHIDHPCFEGLFDAMKQEADDGNASDSKVPLEKPELADVAHTSTSPFNHRWIHPTRTITLKQKAKQAVSFAFDNDFSFPLSQMSGLGVNHK